MFNQTIVDDFIRFHKDHLIDSTLVEFAEFVAELSEHLDKSLEETIE